jgi:hypothetical protein
MGSSAAATWACTAVPVGSSVRALLRVTALGTGRRAFISSESGFEVMPMWLKVGPRMKPSTEAVWALRPKRATKPRS